MTDDEPTTPTRKIIVVVEDDVTIGELIKDTLATEPDYQASLAIDGAQALALLAQVKARLVILDIHLPGLTGYEVRDRIKKIPGAEDVPILFMSSAESPRQIAQQKVEHFLAKPFDLDELMNKVHELIGLGIVPRLLPLLIEMPQDAARRPLFSHMGRSAALLAKHRRISYLRASEICP